MSDTIFDSFLKSVYGSGSSMHLFDGHVDGEMDIIGGVDDLSVEYIFGGEHSFNDDNSHTKTEHEEEDKNHDREGGILSDICLSIVGGIDSIAGGKIEEDKLYEDMNLKIDLNNNEHDNKPNGNLTEAKTVGGLTPHDVAMLISMYR